MLRHGIVHGRELLKKGLKKKIGNGKSFKVWWDPWIFDNCWRAPYRKNTLFDWDLRVSDLINSESRTWNYEILDSIFLPNDIECIKKLKPIISNEDFWCWDHTKSGEYTVKSGYWLASTFKNPELLEEAKSQPSLNGIKHKVWSLQTVPKIKAFLWRAVSDALPVTDLVLKRGIKLDSRCQTCGKEGESINHVLFTCTLARQVWALSNFPSPPNGFDELSVHSNFHYLYRIAKISSVPIETRRLFPWILWRLWKNRNSFFFEAKMFDPLDTILKIREDADQWSLSQQVNIESEMEEEAEEHRNVNLWKPPPAGWLKCNIGTSRGNKNLVSGAAWVLRDEHGSVLLHSRKALESSMNREEADFQSFLWAAESMISHKFLKVIFASESAALTGGILRPKAWPSYAHQQSELLLLLTRIQEWRVLFEKPDSNRGGSLIAQSVPDHALLQSYVSIGDPRWLHELFESERFFSSV